MPNTQIKCKYFEKVQCDLGNNAPYCVMTCPMNIEVEERERAKTKAMTEKVNKK